jgi:murein DD-endopeptidase MepM/ murein hydrolase activator NlpD
MEGDDALENTSKQPSLLKKVMTKKKVIAACFSSFLIIALAFGFFAYKNAVYEILINGTSVGYVKDYDTFKTALNALTNTDGEEVAAKVAAKRKVVFDKITPENETSSSEEGTNNQVATAAIVGLNGSTNETASTENTNTTESSEGTGATAQKQYISSEKIQALARNMLELKQPAVALTIDGNQLAIVPDQDTAQKVIEGIKAYYTPNDTSTEVLSVGIREDIKTADTYEYVGNMLNCDSAVQKIVAGVVTPESYTIQDGDTIWDISNARGISLETIQSQNPGLDINNIQIGDKINLSTTQPYVNVEVVANIKSQETIAYDTEKVNDSTILKGKTKVKQSGQSGTKEVVIKATKVNGIITNEEVASSTVITQPVKEVISVGTKVVKSTITASRGSTSSVSTKGFIRPTNGLLTSNYGYRSGGFHTGIDLANSTGTPIKASKAGTVILAGWNGSYGYCVKIDHGNGVVTLYGHNSKLLVSVGQYVNQGQTISLMGSTGNSTGPHCHFGVYVNGVVQSPWKFID